MLLWYNTLDNGRGGIATERREKIAEIAKTEEDRVLLARVADKLGNAMRRNIPAVTCFLSLREQDLVQRFLGGQEGLCFFGGYPAAERKAACYLPDYLDESYLETAVACLRATFYKGDTPTHRDFLGALMGAGIKRETVGDICVGEGQCDFFLTVEIAPYVQQNLISAGRAHLSLTEIPLSEAEIPEPETQEIRDTVASCRLDSVASSGFRMGRNAVAEAIETGRAAVNGLPCEKPDKPVEQGDVITLRGLGKIRLKEVGGRTKKGRIAIVIEKYI